MILTIVYTCIMSLLVILIAIGNVYVIHKDSREAQRRFELQISSLQVAKKPEVEKISYKDLLAIVDSVIDECTIQDLKTRTMGDKNNEYVSIELDKIMAESCTDVMSVLNKNLVECLYSYVSPDYLYKYIYNRVRMRVIACIEVRKQNNSR